MSKMTDYGIVLLSHFAKASQAEALNARDLAERSKLPLPTVSKILKVLSREELLVSQRGVKGGYRLARPAEQISVAEIIHSFEGPIGVTECGTHTSGTCELEAFCPVRSHWQRISEAVKTALENLSLKDMTQPVASAREGKSIFALVGSQQ